MKKNTSIHYLAFVFLIQLPLLCSAQQTLELMKDLLPGTESSMPESLTAFKNKLYFFAKTDATIYGRSLCVSDGTPDGTEVILPLPIAALGIPDGPLLVIGDTLYFFTKTNDSKYTVWASDGTMGGTNPVLTTMPNESPTSVVVFKDKLWFSFGNQIRYWDAGQNALIDFHTTESGIETLSSSNDYLYWFSIHPLNPYASENKFYRSNGQPGNVQFLENVGQNSYSTSGSSHIEKITRYENGRFRWHTLRVGYHNGGTYYGGGMAGMDSTHIFMTSGWMCILGSARTESAFFLYTEDNYGSQSPPYANNFQLLASSSGTPFQRVLADTAQIKTESVQTTSGLLVATPKQVFFKVWNPDTQTELGISDGSITGTKLVKDINPGPYESKIRNFTVCGDNVIFSAFDGTEYGIWYSDGTESGTQKLASMPTGYQNYANQFTLIVGETLFITLFTNSLGTELWKLSPVSCSGISQSVEPQKHLNFSLLPNPSLPGSTHLLLNESIEPPFQVRLSAISGNILWQKQFNAPTTELEIPTQLLAAGIYFVTLENEGGSTTKKLMLMR
ncbi:MAG: T9SS type A sorting domain-containing protein [Saprospiraceae bacterium]